MLLLGAGESGKSTFGKQLKLLTKGALTDGEMALYRRGEGQEQKTLTPVHRSLSGIYVVMKKMKSPAGTKRFFCGTQTQSMCVHVERRRRLRLFVAGRGDFMTDTGGVARALCSTAYTQGPAKQASRDARIYIYAALKICFSELFLKSLQAAKQRAGFIHTHDHGMHLAHSSSFLVLLNDRVSLVRALSRLISSRAYDLRRCRADVQRNS